jgi:hypothetical protein
MEPAARGALTKGYETRGFVPSIVQPLELSERSDSSKMAKQGSTDGDLAAERHSLATVDWKQVEEAATWISAKIAVTLKRGAQEVGEYLLGKFFRNDCEFARSRTPHKSASFRALAEKCESPELPVSKTWLNNAVSVAALVRQLPDTAKAFKQLPPSFQETLLPLRDPAKVEKMARHAVAKHLTFRKLRQAVAEERAKLPKGAPRSRQAMPVVLKTLNDSLKLLTFAGGKRLFTKADLDGLDEEQRKEALESAEQIIERLDDLVQKLKGG